MMKIDYNVSGAERKKLVQTISQTTGYEATYLKTPTMAYQVGPYHISKEGVVVVSDTEPTLDAVVTAASAAGFTGTAEFVSKPDPEPDDIHEAGEEEAEMNSITITKEGMTPAMIENLRKIIIGKAALIRKAFGVEVLPVLEESDSITFEWFTDLNPDTAKAYMEFISRLRTMAMEAKRVTMTEKPVENEKYAWRCFLLRLGFIGPEHKETRKILMKNFTGSSAFKSTREKSGEENA